MAAHRERQHQHPHRAGGVGDHVETLLESIKAAVLPGATDEARAAGANACRAILAALDARPGEALVVAPPANPLVAAVSMLRSMPPDQLLDLAIARLRAALPAGVTVDPVPPLRFTLLPVPTAGRSP